MSGPFDVSLASLQARTSEKWVRYPPDVLPLWVAELDVALAPAVRAAVQAALDRDDTGYAAPGDLPAAFSEYAAARYGWAVAQERVLLIPDVMTGVSEVLRLTTSPGDGVVINPPVYPPFFETIEAAERRVVEVPLAERWRLDFDALEAAFADGARAFLLCNPHNPTGRVLSREDLERVAELAGRHGVVVLADEIHAPLALAGAVHVPYLSLGNANAVSLTGASKAWNIPGLKCALLVAGSDELRDRLEPRVSTLRDQTGHLGVVASTAAFRDALPWLDELLAELDTRRRSLSALLGDLLPGVGYDEPEATYLAWLDCRSLGLGDDSAAAFLERGRVALTRGLDFGSQGAGYVRLNFGTSHQVLEEAVRRMAAAT